MTSEYRKYEIGGELTPQDWDKLFTALCQIGVNAQEVANESSAPAAETEQQTAPLVNKADMLKFAAEQPDFSEQVAGRSWGVLTQLYSRKTVIPSSSEREKERAQEYAYVPLKFRYHPPVHHMTDQYDFRKQVGDLDLASLDELLAMVDASTERHGPKGINLALGRQTGPAIVTFLKSFSAHQWQLHGSHDCEKPEAGAEPLE